MAFNFKKIWEGIKVVAKGASTSDSQGDVEVLSTDGKIRYHDGTSNSPILTEDHAADVTNKDIITDGSDKSLFKSATGTDRNMEIDVSGATDSKTVTLTSSHTDDRVVTLPDVTGTLITASSTDTLTNKTIDVDNNTVSNIEVDNLKAGVLDTDLSTVSASDDTIPSAKATKTYVDAQVGGQDLDIAGDSGTGAVDLDSQSLTIAGGTGLDSIAGSQTVTLNIDSTVATLTGSQTLTNKTIDVDNNTVSNIETDNLKSTAKTGSDTKVVTGTAGTADNFSKWNADGDLIDSGNTAPVGAIVGTSDSQTLTNKSIDADNNTITNIENSEIKAGAAIDATKIHDGSVDNTEFGYLNGVTSAIQTQLNAKAADGDLTTHISDTTTHGTTGNVVGTSDTQTLTNKTVTGASIVTPSRLDVKQDTKANLVTYAGTAGNGQFVFATDEKVMYQIVDSALTSVGSGGGGLDVWYTEDFETTVATDFSTGNNATFLGGGTIDGTLSDETSSPLSGDSSLKYVMSSASTNDYFASPAITVAEKQQENYQGVTLYYTYDGDDDDVKFVFYDATNSEVLSSSLDVFKTKGSATRFVVSAYIPNGVTSIKWGAHVVTGNNTKILIIDDVEFSSNPFIYKNLLDEQIYTITQAGNALTEGTAETEFNLGTATIINEGQPLIVAEDDSGNTRTKFVAQRDCRFDFSASAPLQNAGFTYAVRRYNSSDSLLKTIDNNTCYSAGQKSGCSGFFELDEGDYITLYSASDVTSSSTTVIFSFHAQAESENVVHANNTVSVENELTASLPNSGTTPTSENVNGWISSFSWTSNTATVVYAELDVVPVVNITPSPTSYTASTTQVTVTYGSPTAFNLEVSKQGSDYKNPTRSVITPTTLTCYIKDLKASGTSAGDSANTTVFDRDLNNLSGDTSFVSLASNTFTLGAGKYKIKARVPAYNCDRHQAFLWNVTDSTYDLDGDSRYLAGGNLGNDDSIIEGIIILTETKSFKIRHWTQSVATKGLGFDGDGTNNPQTTEVYTTIEITKVQ